MATLNAPENGKAVKGRTKKSAPRVDLTAMVDLMFLLTTFFMLTTSLGSLNAAEIAKPIPADEAMPYPASRTMTILLGKNNEAACYMGEMEKAEMKAISIKNMKQEINANKQLVAKTHHNNPAKHMIVIIKPTKTSKFQDFVDVLDEMKIGDIKSYSIDDDHISDREKDFMKSKGL
ncbi:ExbD/TolR family protein [Pedobacter punctiformis]|uniref:Biopolymer transporter ExbD n=1 Tax=Pedobacter punctiformis TaxID=3004097 RepID=A0ABT4L523_9SPHI|nr:biopolymer transporter ExbD [Pedobacter sp. HCMS5-2]MCZ4243021.1 biopolymer transporter ExbD [Pedobacter sp. HCMS5-2]